MKAKGLQFELQSLQLPKSVIYWLSVDDHQHELLEWLRLTLRVLQVLPWSRLLVLVSVQLLFGHSPQILTSPTAQK